MVENQTSTTYVQGDLYRTHDVRQAALRHGDECQHSRSIAPPPSCALVIQKSGPARPSPWQKGWGWDIPFFPPSHIRAWLRGWRLDSRDFGMPRKADMPTLTSMHACMHARVDASMRSCMRLCESTHACCANTAGANTTIVRMGKPKG